MTAGWALLGLTVCAVLCAWATSRTIRRHERLLLQSQLDRDRPYT